MPWGTCKTCLYLAYQGSNVGVFDVIFHGLFDVVARGWRKGYFCLLQKPLGKCRIEAWAKAAASGDGYPEFRPEKTEFFEIAAADLSSLGDRGCNKWEKDLKAPGSLIQINHQTPITATTLALLILAVTALVGYSLYEWITEKSNKDHSVYEVWVNTNDPRMKLRLPVPPNNTNGELIAPNARSVSFDKVMINQDGFFMIEERCHFEKNKFLRLAVKGTFPEGRQGQELSGQICMQLCEREEPPGGDSIMCFDVYPFKKE